MDDDTQAATTEGECCPAGECPLDSDDMSILSAGTGVASFIFACWGFGTWVHILALPLSVAAMAAGWKGLKDDDANHPKLASTGLICGVLGFCLWVIGTVYAELRLLLG